MAYSELVKNFESIRDYMRQFYVYGFKSREEYDAKSARSYDNERRRLESWLGDYMSFRRDGAGKSVFLSVDSRRIPANPLYKAFKAKSFTDKDITLHFYIMDILADGGEHTFRQIVDCITGEYLPRVEGVFDLDESTVRKKLKEYVELGLLSTQKQGREIAYRRTEDPRLDLERWGEALAFYSEQAPVGVVGSYLMDRLDDPSDAFRFKHHYILHALDSGVLCQLLQAIEERRSVELTVKGLKNGGEYRRTLCPLKIYVSVQSGRQYLLGFHYRSGRMAFLRLDAIKTVQLREPEKNYQRYLERQAKFDLHLWGVSSGRERHLDHIEMTVRFGPEEEFIPQRLEREKRHGRVERLDRCTCRFSADVYDPSEMLPWLRTFIGRIVDLQCTDQQVVDTFREDLRQMNERYGGDGCAV